MTTDELIADLKSRINPGYAHQLGTESHERRQCVEALESLRAEVERLTTCLAKANEQAEHFEREWYLLGDEAERLRKDSAKAQVCMDLHEALGVRWGDDPYSAIRNLRQDAERLRVSNDRLVHDLDRAAEDAQRYRWLRDVACTDGAPVGSPTCAIGSWSGNKLRACFGAGLDAAIDAAMKEQQ